MMAARSSRRVPLVLCPGVLYDATLWAAQARDLADIADVRIADFTTQNTIRAMAESVALMAPPQFALAGLSMGGYVAQEVMRLAPERVLCLALLDTSARADDEGARVRRRDLIALAGRGRFRGVTPRMLPLLIHTDRLDDAPLTDAVTAMAESVGRDAFLRQQEAVMARVDGREDLAAITCPTLILCGRDDQLTPADLHLEMAAAIPHADVVMFGGCGHLSPLERPGATTAALRQWLAVGAGA